MSWAEAPRHLNVYKVHYAEQKDYGNSINEITYADFLEISRYPVFSEPENPNSNAVEIGEDLIISFHHISYDSIPGHYLAFSMVCAEYNGSCYEVTNENHVIVSNNHKMTMDRILLGR